MKKLIVLLLFIPIVFSCSSVSKKNLNNPSLNGKKVIYVYGGMEGHSPKESVDFFVPILEKEGAIVKVFNSFRVYEDKELMKEADLIIQVFTDAFSLPQSKVIDRPLLVGAALFGIGWALGGLCPGPAIASLAYLSGDALMFFIPMLVGLYAARFIISKI